eukprot:m.196499 g.196499  ORF g.196499 m.196499 type:complete len:1207 (+) comp13676_c0_seq11:2383-6003(+)
MSNRSDADVVLQGSKKVHNLGSMSPSSARNLLKRMGETKHNSNAQSVISVRGTSNQKKGPLHFSFKQEISSNRGYTVGDFQVFNPKRHTLQEWASGKAQMKRCQAKFGASFRSSVDRHTLTQSVHDNTLVGDIGMENSNSSNTHGHNITSNSSSATQNPHSHSIHPPSSSPHKSSVLNTSHHSQYAMSPSHSVRASPVLARKQFGNNSNANGNDHNNRSTERMYVEQQSHLLAEEVERQKKYIMQTYTMSQRDPNARSSTDTLLSKYNKQQRKQHSLKNGKSTQAASNLSTHVSSNSSNNHSMPSTRHGGGKEVHFATIHEHHADSEGEGEGNAMEEFGDFLKGVSPVCLSSSDISKYEKCVELFYPKKSPKSKQRRRGRRRRQQGNEHNDDEYDDEEFDSDDMSPSNLDHDDDSDDDIPEDELALFRSTDVSSRRPSGLSITSQRISSPSTSYRRTARENANAINGDVDDNSVNANMMRAREVCQRSLFLSLHNGSGAVYYPSGRVAIVVSLTHHGSYSWAYDDTEEKRLLACVSPMSGCVVLDPSTGETVVSTNVDGGILFDERGCTIKEFTWNQPVSIVRQLNAFISLRISSKTDISLMYRNPPSKKVLEQLDTRNKSTLQSAYGVANRIDIIADDDNVSTPTPQAALLRKQGQPNSLLAASNSAALRQVNSRPTSGRRKSMSRTALQMNKQLLAHLCEKSVVSANENGKQERKRQNQQVRKKASTPTTTQNKASEKTQKKRADTRTRPTSTKRQSSGAKSRAMYQSFSSPPSQTRSKAIKRVKKLFSGDDSSRRSSVSFSHVDEIADENVFNGEDDDEGDFDISLNDESDPDEESKDDIEGRNDFFQNGAFTEKNKKKEKKKIVKRQKEQEEPMQTFSVRASCNTPQVFAIRSAPLHTTATIEALRTKASVLIDFLSLSVKEALLAKPGYEGVAVQTKLKTKSKRLKSQPSISNISIAALPTSVSSTGRPEVASFSQHKSISLSPSRHTLSKRRPMTSPAQSFAERSLSLQQRNVRRPHTSSSASGLQRTSSSNTIVCPSAIKRRPSSASTKLCCCSKLYVPELSDQIMDSYLSSKPATLVLVAVVDKGSIESKAFLDIITSLYRENVKIAREPCLSSKTSRYLIYTVDKSRAKKKRLLEKRNGVSAGMLLVFHGTDIVFLHRSIEGRKFTVKGIKEKITGEWKRLVKTKRFLPNNFNASKL